MSAFQAPSRARRRLIRGAVVIWLGLRIGAAGLVLAMTGELDGILLTFSPPAQVQIVALAALLAPLDIRVSRERAFLANLGVGPGEATLVSFLAVAALEGGIGGLVLVAF